MLDAVRLVCDPTQKFLSHVTVRGPYQKEMQPETAVRLSGSEPVEVGGIGNFFNYGQNTVFLRCDSREIRHAWRKPNYPYNPHLTLYDGRSPAFARMLFDALRSMDWEFSFQPTSLQALVSSPGQLSSNIWLEHNKDSLRTASGFELAPETIKDLTDAERVELAKRIAKRISDRYTKQHGGM